MPAARFRSAWITNTMMPTAITMPTNDTPKR